MKVDIDPDDADTYKADNRGRINLGSDYGGEEVEVAILGTGEEDTCCWNCGCNLTDPKNAGFLYEGHWYCSGLCAEVCNGFWSRGEEVEDYNPALAERPVEPDSE